MNLREAMRAAAAIFRATVEAYPWSMPAQDAWELFEAPDITMRNTDSIVIPQFGVVCFDITNPDGVVLFGSANAGAILGVNQSKGIDPVTGAITAGVQIGQSLQVRNQGVTRVIASAACAVGQPQGGAAAGQVGPGGGLGFAMEAAAIAGDIIPLLLNPGDAFAYKQLGTFAAPLVANVTPNTQSSFPHGLGYAPTSLIIVGTQGTAGQVNQSQASDATNIFVKSPVASATFIAYVA